jgi:hypothetical protein
MQDEADEEREGAIILQTIQHQGEDKIEKQPVSRWEDEVIFTTNACASATAEATAEARTTTQTTILPPYVEKDTTRQAYKMRRRRHGIWERIPTRFSTFRSVPWKMHLQQAVHAIWHVYALP